jgi:rare lipoprotein A (peptidoglycan hydrolase)
MASDGRGPFVRGRIVGLSKGAAPAPGGGGLSPVCRKRFRAGELMKNN